MTAPPPSATGLDRILGEQLDSAQSMLDALEREYRALLDGDTEELNRVSSSKARLVEELDALEKARQDLTARDAGPAAGDGRWHSLLELIEECRNRNARNGALARARRDQVLLVLDTLRGGADRLYDQSGSVARGAGTRRLGEA